MTSFIPFIIAILGLVLGSFTSALVYRVPRGESWITKRSRCTVCGASLSVLDLVPLLSWARGQGSCRHCGQGISAIYPVIEAGMAAVCFAAYIVMGVHAGLFFMIAVLPFLFALLVIDIKEMILPNQLVVVVGVIGLARLGYFWLDGTLVIGDILAIHVFGAIVYGALAWFLGWITSVILKRDALGFGDVKFFLVAGLWLGLSNLALFCIVAGVVGVVYASIWQVVLKQRVFPFGPALITSLYLLLLFEGSLFA